MKLPRPSLRVVAPAAVTALGLCAFAWIWRGQIHQIRPLTWLVTGLAFGACALSALTARGERVALRQAIAIALLVPGAALVATRAIGRWPFRADVLLDARYAGLLAIASLAIAIGIARRAEWARWLGMALAGAGVVCGALNTLGFPGNRGEGAWLPVVGLVGGTALLCELGHPALRARFQQGHHALWTSRAPVVRLARWAALTALAATPMLILFGFGQPVTPAAAPWAIALAPVVALGGGLVIARRTAGVLLLGATGASLLALAAVTFALAPPGGLRVAGYYACFWLAAGALGVAAALTALLSASRAPVADP